MNISFQKKSGNRLLGIEFFWKMAFVTEHPVAIPDHFIPELFFDYIFVKVGKIECVDEIRGIKFTLSQQSLKTLYTYPITLTFSTPLVLLGARFSLRFADMYREKGIKPNSFLEQNWVSQSVQDLPTFESQVTDYVHRQKEWYHSSPLLSSELEESDWFAGYSPRHRRRLFKTLFGISPKEMQSIRRVQSFLEQTCDFSSQQPLIIDHINPEDFYDQPHLNHTFKKVTGLSPVEHFEKNSILQDYLMSASYNENSNNIDKI